jgi:hypothetical protein
MWVTHDLKEVTITSFRPVGGDRYSASVGSLTTLTIAHFLCTYSTLHSQLTSDCFGSERPIDLKLMFGDNIEITVKFVELRCVKQKYAL